MTRRRSQTAFTDVVRTMIAVLPDVIDPSASREELGVVASRMDRLATFVMSIEEQEREDTQRLDELRKLPRLTLRELREAQACIGRMIDVERARDLSRTWWTVNVEPLRMIVTRMGEDALAEHLTFMPPSATRINDRRAQLHQVETRLRETWRQRVRWRLAGSLLKIVRERLEAEGAEHEAGEPP